MEGPAAVRKSKSRSSGLGMTWGRVWDSCVRVVGAAHELEERDRTDHIR